VSGILKSLFGKKEVVVVRDEDVQDPGMEETVPGAAGIEPIHVSDDQFEEVVLGADVPVLVDFWAPWCGPCRMIAPVVEDLAQDYEGRALIAKINTDENVEVAGKLGIMGIPTLILFRDGQEIDRVVGFAPRQVLEEKLQAALG
jgi:thioredoxin 1